MKVTRVLLVEDDELVRLSTVELLEALGFSTKAVASADKALETLRTEKFTVMITDMGLPGMSGNNLAAIVRQRHPTLGIVFASGAPPTFRLPANAIWLTKPCNADELASAINSFAG